MVLRIELDPELGDEIELGLEEIDVLFLGMHQILEQVSRHVILDRMAMGGSLLIEVARGMLGLQIAIEHFLDVLPNAQRIEHLHVGKALEKDDARNQLRSEE